MVSLCNDETVMRESMNQDELIAKGKQAVISGDVGQAEECSRKWLELALDPFDLIHHAFTPGIQSVGDLWEDGEFFLPELVAGAEAMKAGMAILEKKLIQGDGYLPSGIVIIGTVQGDIHDIGKSLVATMLRANGFHVIDLGSDVSAQRFLEAYQTHHPRIICLSALLTTTMTGIPEIISLFENQGIRSHIRFLVGGAPVTREWAVQIGADAYASNAVDAVHVTRQLIQEKLP